MTNEKTSVVPDRPRRAVSDAAQPLSHARKLRGLRWMFFAETASAVFSTFTLFGPIAPLYFNELGFSKSSIGLVLSLLPFFGMITPFFAGWIARTGFRFVCRLFYSIRKTVLILFLLLPWVARNWGVDAAFAATVAIVGVFAFSRAMAEAAVYSWTQEIIPNSVRGKAAGIMTILGALAIIAGSVAAGAWLKAAPGMNGYLAILAVGLLAGFVYLFGMFHYPGGAPVARPAAPHAGSFPAQLLSVFRDRTFAGYILAMAMISLGCCYWVFFPLYLKGTLGLKSEQVFLFDAFGYAGILFSCFFWGWCADRFGSKPVLLVGLWGWTIGALFWLLIPANSAWTLPAACAFALVIKVFSIGYATGMNRYLFVRAVPAEKRHLFMPVFYAASGLAGGIAPMLAGYFLDRAAGGLFPAGLLRMDGYLLLVALCTIPLLIALRVVHHLPYDGPLKTREFLGMMVQGHPLLAIASMIRFRYAGGESGRIASTERMGSARSSFSADELLDALSDPSFNVRYEAVVAISRMPPNGKLTAALVDIVRRKVPELSMTAAWALGRIGDRGALPALREAMGSEYALLRARIARSLGTLNDRESAPRILLAFRSEPCDGVRVAYATALGSLKAVEALPELLAFLRRTSDPVARGEVTLAVARMLGGEHRFTRLWAAARTDLGSACAETLGGLGDRLGDGTPEILALRGMARECADAWMAGDTARAAALLAACARAVPEDGVSAACRDVLRECALGLESNGVLQRNYAVLLLFALVLAGVEIRQHLRLLKRA